MGIVAFDWGVRKLTLLQNRDNWGKRVINAAAWDETNNILGGRCRQNGGTWFGCSRNGRIAFVEYQVLETTFVDVVNEPPEILPLNFLQGTLSPREFADNLVEEERSKVDGVPRRSYELIVADITLSSMFHITCKPMDVKPKIDIEQVAFGVHTLSQYGLDWAFPRDLRLKGLFNEMIIEYGDQELPALKQIAAKFMYDDEEATIEDGWSAVFIEMALVGTEDHYGTTSTTAFAAKPNGEVKFFERYLKRNDDWRENDFEAFKIE